MDDRQADRYMEGLKIYVGKYVWMDGIDGL